MSPKSNEHVLIKKRQRGHSMIVNWMSWLKWVTGCPNNGYTLFWVCLEYVLFLMRLIFAWIDWVKQTDLLYMDGLYPLKDFYPLKDLCPLKDWREQNRIHSLSVCLWARISIFSCLWTLSRTETYTIHSPESQIFSLDWNYISGSSWFPARLLWLRFLILTDFR